LDKFGFFFGFYGLILGLAVAELLNGLGALARAGELRRLGWQTGLLGLFLLLVVCATWIDAWESLRGVSLDFDGLWAPILIAVLYYLAAAVTFPKNPSEWTSLDDYFVQRKRFCRRADARGRVRGELQLPQCSDRRISTPPRKILGLVSALQHRDQARVPSPDLRQGSARQYRHARRDDPVVPGAVLAPLNLGNRHQRDVVAGHGTTHLPR
jgi:hypothetical protein